MYRSSASHVVTWRPVAGLKVVRRRLARGRPFGFLGRGQGFQIGLDSSRQADRRGAQEEAQKREEVERQ